MVMRLIDEVYAEAFFSSPVHSPLRLAEVETVAET